LKEEVGCPKSEALSLNRVLFCKREGNMKAKTGREMAMKRWAERIPEGMAGP
jgi:hypothetical protein